MSFLWNILQESELSTLRDQSLKDQRTYATRHELQELESALSRSVLINQALYEILKTRFGISEAELVEKMKEVDLRDGVADGKITSKKQRAQSCSCKKCGVSQSIRYTRCIYCGTPLR